MRHAFLVAALVGIGCGSPPKPAATIAPRKTAVSADVPDVFDVDSSVPGDLRTTIDHAQRLGRVLVAFDTTASFATDLLREKNALEGVVGWLVQPRAQGALEVVFFVASDPPAIGRRVLVSPGNKPIFERVEPPVLASPELATLFRARALVLASIGKPEQPLDPIVLPGIAIDEQGIVVYLLAGTDRKDVAVLGKHYRARATVDAAKVLSLEPLSQTPIEFPLHANVPGSTSAGIVVTHLVDHPLETDVYASLLHRTPIYVKTARGIWKVNGDRISFQPG